MTTPIPLPLLDDPRERATRQAMLGAPHARALAAYAASLRRETGAHVPDIDPRDGGTEARIVLLLETPGPAIRNTGFVSATTRPPPRATSDASQARRSSNAATP